MEVLQEIGIMKAKRSEEQIHAWALLAVGIIVVLAPLATKVVQNAGLTTGLA